MKRTVLIIPTVLILLFLIHTQALAAQSGRISLFLDGMEINTPEPPFLYENTTLVPAREFFESAGANVTWYPDTQQVVILYDGSLLSMTVGEKTAWLDGENVEMSVPPMIRNNKTMIPLRFPAECFGFGVEWKQETQSAHLFTPMSDGTPLAEPPAEQLPAEQSPTVQSPVEQLPSEQPPVITDPSIEPPAVSETPAVSEPPAVTDPAVSSPPASETPAATDSPLNIIPPFIEIPASTAKPTAPVDFTPPASSEGSAARDVSSSEIQPMQYNEVTVQSLLTPKETGGAAYIATASGPISEVQKTLLPDNRLIIDITNALHGLEGPFYTDASVPVTEVRSSQFMDVPSITRLVFDLTGGAEYAVSLSADRTRLTVSFSRNVITDVSFNSTGTSDSVTVTGITRPMVQMLPATNPDRFVININNATLSHIGAAEVSGKFATMINSVQTDASSARVELTVKEWPSFEIVESGNSVTIRYFTNTLLGVSYDYMTKEIRLKKTPELTFDINSAVHQDEYTRGLYTITLPVDGEAVWGHGDLLARDGYIETIKVNKNAAGQTQLIIQEARVLAFTVSEDENSYIIKPMLPKDAYRNIVLIDPGHGGSEPGTEHNGVLEKNFNLSVSLKLMELLNADPNIKAYATRLDDSDFDLHTRPVYANEFADLFVSIHANSFVNNTDANGTEIYYYPHDNDAWLGFSSQRFAEMMNERFKSMLDIGNRGVKSNVYVVLHYTTMPAILCEMGFTTNKGDAAKLLDEQYQWQMAYTLYYGIQDAFGVYRPVR